MQPCVFLCVFVQVPRRCPVQWMRSPVTSFCRLSPAKSKRDRNSYGRKIIKKSQISPKKSWLRQRAASKTHTHTQTVAHTQFSVCKEFFVIDSVCVCSSKLIFKNASKEDFGTFSVSVTNTEGVSSSYTVSAEGKNHPSLSLQGSRISPAIITDQRLKDLSAK